MDEILAMKIVNHLIRVRSLLIDSGYNDDADELTDEIGTIIGAFMKSVEHDADKTDLEYSRSVVSRKTIAKLAEIITDNRAWLDKFIKENIKITDNEIAIVAPNRDFLLKDIERNTWSYNKFISESNNEITRYIYLRVCDPDANDGKVFSYTANHATDPIRDRSKYHIILASHPFTKKFQLVWDDDYNYYKVKEKKNVM